MRSTQYEGELHIGVVGTVNRTRTSNSPRRVLLPRKPSNSGSPTPYTLAPQQAAMFEVGVRVPTQVMGPWYQLRACKQLPDTRPPKAHTIGIKSICLPHLWEVQASYCVVRSAGRARKSCAQHTEWVNCKMVSHQQPLWVL